MIAPEQMSSNLSNVRAVVAALVSFVEQSGVEEAELQGLRTSLRVLGIFAEKGAFCPFTDTDAAVVLEANMACRVLLPDQNVEHPEREAGNTLLAAALAKRLGTPGEQRWIQDTIQWFARREVKGRMKPSRLAQAIHNVVTAGGKVG